jgi:hypothetical protein
MATAKNPYGLWLVTTLPVKGSRVKTKFVAVIESNEKGGQKWLHQNGLRPERHTFRLLPAVEYFDPVDDLHGMLTTGGVRIPKGKKAVLPKVPTATTKHRTTATGHCTGSGAKVLKSQVKTGWGSKVGCPVCQKKLAVNGDNWRGYTIRKHK